MERHLQSVWTPVLSTVLRSPLHTLLDHRTMLLTFTGRKSGQTYTFPVNFARRDGGFTVMSSRDRHWWLNMTDGAPVTMHVDGRDITGTAKVLNLDEHEMSAVLRDYWQRTFEHQLCGERALAMLPEKVLIHIVPDSEPVRPVA